MKYRGASTWDRQTYNLDRKVNYIKYFESFSVQPKINLPQMRKNFLTRIEYDKLKLQNNSGNSEEINNVKQFTRRRGLLKKKQLNLIYNWDLDIIKNMKRDPPPSPPTTG